MAVRAWVSCGCPADVGAFAGGWSGWGDGLVADPAVEDGVGEVVADAVEGFTGRQQGWGGGHGSSSSQWAWTQQIISTIAAPS